MINNQNIIRFRADRRTRERLAELARIHKLTVSGFLRYLILNPEKALNNKEAPK